MSDPTPTTPDELRSILEKLRALEEQADLHGDPDDFAAALHDYATELLEAAGRSLQVETLTADRDSARAALVEARDGMQAVCEERNRLLALVQRAADLIAKPAACHAVDQDSTITGTPRYSAGLRIHHRECAELLPVLRAALEGKAVEAANPTAKLLDWMDRARAKRVEVTEPFGTEAGEVRRVKLPKRWRFGIRRDATGAPYIKYWDDENGEVVNAADTIAAIRAAGVEVEP